MHYVLSDIHGDMDAFEKILSLIRLTDMDRLYILGDVIDKGDYGIEILQRIRNMPQCFMLLGNHELMMLNVYRGSNKDRARLVWENNDCYATEKAFSILPDDEKEELLDYLGMLPVQTDIEVGGRVYTLVHAAPLELYEAENRRRRTKTEFAVWHRMTAGTHIPDEKIVIFGHEPTMFLQVTKGNMQIFHGDHKIGIDCGCGYPYLRGQLGCLRLEDMTEIYSKDGVIPASLRKERQ